RAQNCAQGHESRQGTAATAPVPGEESERGRRGSRTRFKNRKEKTRLLGKTLQEERLGRPAQFTRCRTLPLCRERQLLLRFFRGGSSQLKPNRASLVILGAKRNRRSFYLSQIKRGAQREKVAISNRLPRFGIRACSSRVQS